LLSKSKEKNCLFIALGSFHIELAFFSAIGKIVAESGGEGSILQESEDLAKGSLNGLITGKNYKRCKRLHEMLAVAFETPHFQRFVDLQDAKTEIVNNLMQEDPVDKMETIAS